MYTYILEYMHISEYMCIYLYSMNKFVKDKKNKAIVTLASSGFDMIPKKFQPFLGPDCFPQISSQVSVLFGFCSF